MMDNACILLAKALKVRKHNGICCPQHWQYKMCVWANSANVMPAWASQSGLDRPSNFDCCTPVWYKRLSGLRPGKTLRILAVAGFSRQGVSRMPGGRGRGEVEKGGGGFDQGQDFKAQARSGVLVPRSSPSSCQNFPRSKSSRPPGAASGKSFERCPFCR